MWMWCHSLYCFSVHVWGKFQVVSCKKTIVFVNQRLAEKKLFCKYTCNREFLLYQAVRHCAYVGHHTHWHIQISISKPEYLCQYRPIPTDWQKSYIVTVRKIVQIFHICFSFWWMLSPRLSTSSLPLDPTGDLHPQTPWLGPLLENMWIPCEPLHCTILGTPMACTNWKQRMYYYASCCAHQTSQTDENRLADTAPSPVNVYWALIRAIGSY